MVYAIFGAFSTSLCCILLNSFCTDKMSYSTFKGNMCAWPGNPAQLSDTVHHIAKLYAKGAPWIAKPMAFVVV